MSAGLKEVLIRYLQNENPSDKAELKQYIDFGKFQSFKKRVVRNFNQQKGENVKALEYNNKSFKEAYANPDSRDLISSIIRDLPMGYKSESPPPTTLLNADITGVHVTGSGSSEDPYLQAARVPKYLEKNVNKQIAKQQRKFAMQQAQTQSPGQQSNQIQPIKQAPKSGQGSATVTPVASSHQPAQLSVQGSEEKAQGLLPQGAAQSLHHGPVKPGQHPQQGPVQQMHLQSGQQHIQQGAHQQQGQMLQGQTTEQHAAGLAQAPALTNNQTAQTQAARAQQMQLQQAQQLLQLQQHYPNNPSQQQQQQQQQQAAQAQLLVQAHQQAQLQAQQQIKIEPITIPPSMQMSQLRNIDNSNNNAGSVSSVFTGAVISGPPSNQSVQNPTSTPDTISSNDPASQAGAPVPIQILSVSNPPTIVGYNDSTSTTV